MRSINRIYLLLTAALLLVVNNLSPFIPERFNFSNDYQHQLFISWIERGNFHPAVPADISQQRIRAYYQNQQNGINVKAEFDLKDAVIVMCRETVPDHTIQTDIPQQEHHYRFFLELFLFRLNSDRSFFAEDLANGLGVTLSLEIEGDSNEKGLYLFAGGERFEWNRILFSSAGYSYRYSLETTTGKTINLQLPEYSQLNSRLPATMQREKRSEQIEQLRSDRDMTNTVTSLSRNYSEAYPARRDVSVNLPYHTDSTAPDRSLPLKKYIETYRDQIWGLEMIHNKIDDPVAFLVRELPRHELRTTSNSYQLTAPPFRENITPNLELIRKELKDGVMFDTLTDFDIDENGIATLITGDRISLSELNDQEIEIITPFLNQLNAMHRVMGSRLINFFLIPADVRTIFVLRDPDRSVSEFVSYTDLILMLSHYWKGRIVHFGIERVKKVNNYIELDCLLVGVCHDSGKSDFAEVKFALSKSFRIDLAMMTLHTNVEPIEE